MATVSTLVLLVLLSTIERINMVLGGDGLCVKTHRRRWYHHCLEWHVAGSMSIDASGSWTN